MIYTQEKINDIINQLNELAMDKEYSDYFIVKNKVNIDTVNKEVWGKSWSNPFGCDYITELFDNTYIPRKIMKRPKKEFSGQHFLLDDIPVYSVYYRNLDEIWMEKIYISLPEKRIELLFGSDKHILIEVDLTSFDNHGNPVEFSKMSISEEGTKEIFSVHYYFEQGMLIKADSIYKLNPEKEIVLYEEADIHSRRMNPGLVQEHILNYENNAVQTFTRIDYEYGSVYQNTWKIRRNVIKNYIECGISYLGE